jgi:formylglycine-generating enzyme required for sulfatase activity
MTSSLQALGFTVTTLTDSNQRAMDQAIRKFGKTLRNQGGVGLFYYAGHGMQVDGENFLLPVDIDPSTEADVHYDAVPVGKLLGQMEAAGNGMNIVILDACRNNPFARSFRSASKGLAQVSAPSGTFISYATGPGKVAADGEGGNGLFTEKLVAHLATPGLKLEEVFKRVRGDVQRESMGKQVPWDSSSVTGDFFFVSASAEPAVSAALPKQEGEFTLDDLDEEAKREESARLAWDNKLEEMRSAVEQARGYERRKISPSTKVKVWRRFLTAFSEDNPYSGEDETLRNEAQNQIGHWQAAEHKRQEELAALRQKQESEGVWTEPITGMKFVSVPGGSFEIGDQFGEGEDDEKNNRKITIKPFRLGVTEVTQREWKKIMGSNPSNFKGNDLPVHRLSWKDIQNFIKKLNARSGKGFRLPTEAEWEYACREGGRKVRYCNGKDEASKSEIHYDASFSTGTKPVGNFAPNSLGFYDMSGNVWEWTCSAYTASYDGSEEECSVSAGSYSLRGGSWLYAPRGVRAAYRGSDGGPGYLYGDIGFRLAQD